jgi:CrcB protein
MTKVVLIALGGAIGTVGRYAISGLAQSFSSIVFPIGTLTVNLIGSFIIGILWALFEPSTIHPQIRSLIFIGVLGGFTTFSSYSLETINLLRDGEIKLAFINLLLHNVLGIGLTFLGFVLVKQLQH